MNPNLEISLDDDEENLNRASKLLRDRQLHDVIVPGTGGITVVCTDGLEVDLNWKENALEYNGHRSSFKLYARDVSLAEKFRHLRGQLLDSFQVARGRAYLVAKSGDAIRFEHEGEKVRMSSERTVFVPNV